MDVDPLADTVPPRHAIESDEEEDEYNPIDTKTTVEPNQTIDVKLMGDLPQSRSLVITTGDVAKFWARGADLGEQSGMVSINGIQVGLAFRPAWTKAVVIISEVMTRLPHWAMFPYARTILDALKPTSVSLLDTYPVATYITAAPVSFQDIPIRYLSTSSVIASLKHQASTFSPPNLLQSTSAAFLSILNTSIASPGTVVLVPSPYIPHPSSKALSLSNFSHLPEDRFEWSHDTMKTVQKLLFAVIGESAPPKWENTRGADISATRRRTNDVGESGMYI